MAKRTWQISDIDGSNKRTVTLEQYRAEVDASKRAASEKFQHSVRELAILNRAHATMMAHLNAGHGYDVAKRAWVDEKGNVVA
jgi:hypothetical protein